MRTRISSARANVISTQKAESKIVKKSKKSLTYCISYSILHYTLYIRQTVLMTRGKGDRDMDPEIRYFETEMNRGFLQILVLAMLEKDMYGYSMVRTVRDLGSEVEENTLYRLLRRLEET